VDALKPVTDLRRRLCQTLVQDALLAMERDLVEIKSIRFLADYPWAPGKRLRPITFLLSYLSVAVERSANVAVNGRESRLAAAIELLHEASLVHDDLVDRSLVRRGKPTMQVVNGDSLALLIGDYMVFRGLKLILDVARSREDIVLAQQLADTGLAIAHGEVDQLDAYLNNQGVERRMSMDHYIGVIGKKTAAFFAGCAESGAALAGSDEKSRELYRSFGMAMGLVFQMADDLMDIVGDAELARKSLRSNVSEGTITLPMIHAHTLFPGHPALAKLASGDKLTRSEQSALHRMFSGDDVVDRCRATMAGYYDQSVAALQRMPFNIYREGLHDLLDYVRDCSWGGLDGRPERSGDRGSVQ
jgi:octaprenyl-diphosphate synthase